MSPVISVPFGKYSRMSPLVFSFVPRSHGEWVRAGYIVQSRFRGLELLYRGLT